MDPNSGGNPPDAKAPASFAAFAHLTGKEKDGGKNEGAAQPPAAGTTSAAPSWAMGAPEQAQNMFTTTSSSGGVAMSNFAPAFSSDSVTKTDEPPSSANEALEDLKTDNVQDVEMKEEDESSTGAEDTDFSAPKKLRAIVGEQTVNVRVKVDNEVVEDDAVAEVDRSGIERSVSSSTNTSVEKNQRPMETDEYPQQQEEHHHSHRTRSSSFDIAQALVNANNNIMDQETNTTNSSFSNPPADFADASLLLGLTDTAALPSKPVRGELEPATLPSTMTFFLDMLNENQRRVRHRHIPAVDGFRKLYKNEIKQDLAAARALNRKSRRGDETMMEGDEEMKDELSENDGLADRASAEAETFQEGALPDSDAFVAPTENTIAFAHCGQLASLMESTPFENSMRGGVSASTLRSPQLVESLTAFNPPRPQESTATKSKHRLKRWESNPQDVEVDLLNYKKTVQRTRMELHKAEDEHAQIEAVASMMRTQYMNHLDAYREETAAVGEQLRAVKSHCFKAAEEHNGKTISTRGSSKSMRDVFAALKSLGDDLGAKATGSGGGTHLLHSDWRVSGLGGIASSSAEESASANDSLANGWILVGDKVKTPTGESGTVEKIIAPSIKKVLPKENNKDSNAKDVDNTKTDADAPSVKKEEPSLSEMVVPEGISVRFDSGTVTTFSFSDLKLEAAPFPCAKDSDLVKRWENMKQSAIDTGSRHDYSGMNSQVIASVLRRQQEDDQDGSVSPKSVTQYDDLSNVVPFGAGIISAPQQIRDFSSIIPVNALEENVRKVIYESGKDVQVIPAMPPSVEKYESQRENLNKLKIKVLQLRNRLGRQKRIRGLNERSLKAGKKRADKVEGLLIEMQTDLISLKGRLQEELDELGIGSGQKDNINENVISFDSQGVAEGVSEPDEPMGEKRSLENGGDPDSKRARVE